MSRPFAPRASQPTGVALIWVDRCGQNSIVVASGANHELLPGEVESMRPTFRGATFVLFQLETPLQTVAGALQAAREEGARTILDPAPAQRLPREMLEAVDILTPNETEASILLGRDASRITSAEAPALACALLGLGCQSVVLKLGEGGCYYHDGAVSLHSPGFAVEGGGYHGGGRYVQWRVGGGAGGGPADRERAPIRQRLGRSIGDAPRSPGVPFQPEPRSTASCPPPKDEFFFCPPFRGRSCSTHFEFTAQPDIRRRASDQHPELAGFHHAVQVAVKEGEIAGSKSKLYRPRCAGPQ